MHACEEVLGPAVPAVAMHLVPGNAGRRVEVPDKLDIGEMRVCDLLRYTCCTMKKVHLLHLHDYESMAVDST